MHISTLATDSPRTFAPTVHVVREGDQVFDVLVDAFAPNSCFEENGHALEFPPGVDLSIPEYEHLVCRAQYTGGLNRRCLMYLKPLRWDCQNLTIGSGKTHLAVHIVASGVLVGTTVVQLPTVVHE